jgi:intergrase/recombinase
MSRAWGVLKTAQRVMTMTNTTAKVISELMVSMGARLNESVRLVQATEDDSEFKRYRDSVSKIMTIMLLEVMNPLYAEHPELKPPEIR